SEVANQEKMFPKAWITADGTDVNENAYKYFLPLIQGEQVLQKQNGLPVHFKIREEILRG
ncbi:MAG: 6-phosphofructokinase, partial [Ruminiclostridium sp.]|nr:6-phosphofructokinase [Ruminiclostridium sp.]